MATTNDALVDVLSGFARTLSGRFDVADVLYALADQTVDVLDATAAGVSLVDHDHHLEFVSASTEAAARLERVQQDSKQGPCRDAFATGTLIAVDDLLERSEWPIYRAAAIEMGFRSVMGVPLAAGERRVGALNVYHEHAREWSDDAQRAAQILADVATGYVLHASNLDQATRLTEQLQEALDSRIVIEQAKGLLAGESGISLDAAFQLLRSHARSKQATLRSVAEAVVSLGLRLTPLDQPSS